MVKLTLTISACMLISACVPRIVTKQQIVEKDVPIYVVPAPPDTQRPILDIDKLTVDDRKNSNVEAKAIAVSLEQLKKYAESLELIVNKYREVSNTSTPITNFNPKTPALLDIDKLKEFIDKYTPGKQDAKSN